MPDRPHKICLACGRRFEWRKKWERDWEQVRYCSDACRRSGEGDGAAGRAMEQTILDLLSNREKGATICPSEAARVIDPENWRPLMEPARRAARRLAARGLVVITQKGKPVGPPDIRGPVRIRRR